MDIEQYQGLLKLTLGTGIFVIMLLALRLKSLQQKTSSAETNTSPWIGFEPLEVVRVIDETPTVRSLILRRLGSKSIPEFKAGQFVSIQIANDPKVIRSYSISSPDSEKRFIQISVKRISGGTGSEWLHKAKAGSQLMASAPSGHFVDSAQDDLPRVFIAGGIGITPVLSIIQSQLESFQGHSLHLFYGARSLGELAFHHLLSHLAQRNDNFKYHYRLSHEPSTLHPTGFVDLNWIQNTIGQNLNGYFFICGPDVMTEPLIEALSKAGVPEERIIFERFISPSDLDVSKIPERQVQIKLDQRTLNYAGRDNLLSFLESQNVFLPYSCRSGVCGSCKCKVQGPAMSLSDSGLTRSEKREGYRLACVTFPEGDIVVSTK